MGEEVEKKPEWRYFLRDYELEEVYLWPNNGKKLHQQKLEDVQLLFEDGSWNSNYRERLLDVTIKGWFAETQDEISEQEAMSLYEKWKKAGKWPGGRFTRIDKR
jgi:hypothetical protein